MAQALSQHSTPFVRPRCQDEDRPPFGWWEVVVGDGDGSPAVACVGSMSECAFYALAARMAVPLGSGTTYAVVRHVCDDRECSWLAQVIDLDAARADDLALIECTPPDRGLAPFSPWVTPA